MEGESGEQVGGELESVTSSAAWQGVCLGVFPKQFDSFTSAICRCTVLLHFSKSRLKCHKE